MALGQESTKLAPLGVTAGSHRFGSSVQLSIIPHPAPPFHGAKYGERVEPACLHERQPLAC